MIELWPSWAKFALCSDPSIAASVDFFDPRQADDARRICRRCPVRRDCLPHAIEAGEAYGVWGGLGPMARKSLRRKRIRRGCPSCESTSLMLLRPHQLCRACGLSWEVAGDALPSRKGVHAGAAPAFDQQSA